MAVNTINTEVFINHLRDTLRNPDNRICFILGAGASVESGISSGATLAKQWYAELPNYHSAERIAVWKEKVKFDEKDIPAFYSKLFRLRYEGHQDDGIHFISGIIEQGNPGFGYTILSQVLQRTPHNVVVTTNFDTLTEESLFVYTNKRGLVCNHENVAHLARPSSTRPLVVKIHRGLYMDPLNDEDDIADLKEEWKKALTGIFRNYIPVVIGYGGNDGSLMNYLNSIDCCQRMYWCLRTDAAPREDIIKVVERHRGHFVRTGGFNRLMFRFIDLFGLTKMHEVMEQLAKDRAEKLRKEFEDAGKDIAESGTTEEKKELGKVAEEFDKTNWVHWELKASAAKEPEEKEAIYREALENLPESHELNYNLGCLLTDLNRSDEAIYLYKKAVEIKPDKIEALFNLGNVYSELGKNDEAIDAYDRAIKINRDMHQAWNNLGAVYFNIKKYDKAIEHYKKALEIKPDKHITWYNLGESNTEKGDMDNALKCFEEAYRLDPTDEDYKKAMEGMKGK